MGELSFVFRDGYSLYCSVFITNTHRGKMKETLEATPFWCPVDSIPYEEMWEDDELWFPFLLRNEYFRGYFIFDGDDMISYRLNV